LKIKEHGKKVIMAIVKLNLVTGKTLMNLVEIKAVLEMEFYGLIEII
jgi:hypothetical protein